MGRLHHLRETLPRSLAAVGAAGDVEFVVLDWNSSDGLAEWLRDFRADHRSPITIRAYRATAQRRWHHARAKNCAHRLASGVVLVNLDADNWLTPGYVVWLRSTFAAHPRSVCGFAYEAPSDCVGRLACARADFVAAGGYREDLTGWGVEDGDLQLRLMALGCRLAHAPASEARAIQHGDAERTRFTAAGRIRRSLAHTRRMMIAGLARGDVRANSGRAWGEIAVEPI